MWRPACPSPWSTRSAPWRLAQPAQFLGPVDLDPDVIIGSEGALLATWWYAAVGSFTTLADDVALVDLQNRWAAGSLLAPAGDLPLWTAAWGAGGAADENIPEALWAGGDAALALLPFEAVTPDLKVLAIAGQTPLDPQLPAVTYPLLRTFGAGGNPEGVAALLAAWTGPRTNRDPARMTRVAVTGVTALTRGTAYQMELNGVAYPGQEVAALLRSADIAHVSHEVAFASDCPFPDPLGGTLFCARDSYLELLSGLGIDVIELTGNHVKDWGPENLARSIDMYEAAGMAVYGGGRDLAAAAVPALFSHNGNRIAFVGCNPVGPAYAWATATAAGANPCGSGLAPQVAALVAEGYLVIATLQESELYGYAPSAAQRGVFQALAEAGAVVVSGSQAHHVQGYDVSPKAVVHYGPGNLFFDQMMMPGTRQTVIDSYVFYDGRLVGVEIWAGLIENYARPRLMTAAERADLLRTLFSVTGRFP